MFILLIISFFFIWLIYRELTNDKELDQFTKGYIAVLTILALLTCYPIVNHWRFENLLSRKAAELADNDLANVQCATVFQSVYDKFGFAGLAYYETGDIRLQYPTCNQIREYLASPATASPREVYSFHVFVHEAMHIRGERNEQKTDCQAIQRFVEAAKMFNVRTHIAERNVQGYYTGYYQQHPYFTKECAPGKSMDENLPSAFW